MIPKYLLNQKIIINKITNLNLNGDYDEVKSFEGNCRIEQIDDIINSNENDLENYNWVIYVNGDVDTKPNSTCIFNNQKFIIKKIKKHYYMTTNVAYTEIMVV